jgi:hypothetical protein
LKNGYFVILNEMKDLESIDMTRFFVSLRMTMRQLRRFFNSLLLCYGRLLPRAGPEEGAEWPGFLPGN